jgi:hypothetical protein
MTRNADLLETERLLDIGRGSGTVIANVSKALSCPVCEGRISGAAPSSS